jgi:hypothetical protein
MSGPENLAPSLTSREEEEWVERVGIYLWSFQSPDRVGSEHVLELDGESSETACGGEALFCDYTLRIETEGHL